MKILVMSEFHGTFPKKFKTLIKKEKIDLVVSLGDYPPFHYKKLFFKYCYGKDINLWEIIGKKRYKALVMEDLRRAETALKALNKLPIPIFTVLGNADYPFENDVADISSKRKKIIPSWYKTDALAKRMKKYKNIKRFDYSYLKFGNYIFIGMRGHSFPGRVKSKAYKRHRKKLNKLFKKFRKENKEGRVIFVSHNVANNTKLDKLSSKAVKFALKHAGKKKRVIKERRCHYGSKLARRIIDSYHPLLHLGGHIHEAWGKDKLGRTLLVNPGAVHEGKAAVIELREGKVKSVKFIR